MSYSIFDAIKDSMSGKLIISDNEKIQKRIEICNVCDKLTKPFRLCSKCGCLVDSKVKLNEASCPLGKW